MLTLIVAALLVAPGPVADPGLASKIHQLMDAGFSDTAPASDAARLQSIFEQRGLPTIAMVGPDAAEEFIVLAAHEQPVEFMRQVLAAAERAAGAVPPHAVQFLRARVKQKAIEAGLHPPYSDAKLAARLSTLYASDQAVRKGDHFDAAKMRETDAHNGQEIRALFTTFGVPTRSAVGPDAARRFVVMVQHQPPDLRRAVLPKLRENVDRGEADPADYAMMFDRARVDGGKPQRYGANFSCQADGSLGPSPIEDPDRVDARRAEIGLLPMRLYSRRLRQSMPPDFCKKVVPPKTP